MLRLVNISVNGDLASADFYPEDCPLCGHIAVNLSSNQVKAFQPVPGYESGYLGMARQGLIAAAKKTSIPREYLVMWY